MNLSVKQITRMGIIIVFALMVSYMERLIPSPIPILPGIKLGLANIIVLVLMYLTNNRTAFCINIFRILLAGLLFTGVWGMIYALSGAILSFTAMAVLKASRGFGIVGVSVIGGVCHNLGQLGIAALVMENVRLFYYFPALIVSGVIAGVLIGYLAGLLIRRLGKSDLSIIWN